MIQNLNFYDIYGYLIPGLTLSILIWLPLGLIEKRWPTADWTSALVAVVIGYVVGHVLQVLARNALPSKTMHGRYPSDALLDKEQKSFSQVLKARLRVRIEKLSGIDVRTDLESKDITEEVRTQRREAFLFCRDTLLTAKIISYAEQMQGMYTLTNGLTVAFSLGAAQNLGWALSGIQRSTLEIVASLFVGLGLAGAILVAVLGSRKNASSSEAARMTRARWTVGFAMAALLGSGYILGVGRVSNLDQRGRLAVVALTCVFSGLTCFASYKYFTKVYAETIYRAFNLYEKPDKPSEAK